MSFGSLIATDRIVLGNSKGRGIRGYVHRIRGYVDQGPTGNKKRNKVRAKMAKQSRRINRRKKS